MKQPEYRRPERCHRRVTFIAPQDKNNPDPFAPTASIPQEAPPEEPREFDVSNDARTVENIPPHFGKL